MVLGRFLLGVNLFVFTNFSYCQSDIYILDKGKAGKANINMQVDLLYIEYGKINTKIEDLYLEAMFSPCIEVFLDNQNSPSLICELDCDKIWRISVLSSKFKTAKNISIGSAVSDLINNYSDYEIFNGENGVYIFIKEINISFLIDFSPVNGKLDIGSIPKNSVILKILVL